MSEVKLSGRELDVVGQLARGHSNKEIASALFISEHTVKFHVNNATRKLSATSRVGTVIRALKLGFLNLDAIDVPLTPSVPSSVARHARSLVKAQVTP